MSHSPLAAALGAIHLPVEADTEPRLYRVEIRVGHLDWTAVTHLPVYTDRDTAEAAQEAETRRCWTLRDVLDDHETDVDYRVTSIPYVWTDADVEGVETDHDRIWGATFREITQMLADDAAIEPNALTVRVHRGLCVVEIGFRDGERTDRAVATAAAMTLRDRYKPEVVTVRGRNGDFYEVHVHGPFPLAPTM